MKWPSSFSTNAVRVHSSMFVQRWGGALLAPKSQPVARPPNPQPRGKAENSKFKGQLQAWLDSGAQIVFSLSVSLSFSQCLSLSLSSSSRLSIRSFCFSPQASSGHFCHERAFSVGRDRRLPAAQFCILMDCGLQGRGGIPGLPSTSSKGLV